MSDTETRARLTALKHRFRRLWTDLAGDLVFEILIVAVIGLLFVLPLPSIDLPSIPIPDVPELPDWLASALKWAKFGALVVLGALLAIAAVDRRGKSEAGGRAEEV